ncbi:MULTISPECIES: cytochrome c [unclassified Cupriavidus]|uniref:c-type cytochrome n=1 Tax=unclassified Cupriavidus TaxID=2640874 RepID=UPI001BFFEFE1|nr:MULTISPECIES: cytochrome c [unclassified Cupriavidus]MCA3186775.1 cytochrome c [Cupriavidus sp.]MCA3191462.1 cytochrome c [Cupriavidus sp.]MCA3197428.1 cytochrome c [Cupriavidus sp.]MCA3201777.1 cytochrome c [Cupriavidus sp.]MCA3208089.1 cytochrome c [Cupriavidus sp.]
MSAPPPQAWLNSLLRLVQDIQLALLQVWHALGWSGDVHGQPAWPWAQRIAGETLLIDLGLARQLALTVLAVALALACLAVALCWRRRRLAWLGIGALALVAAPWPSLALLVTPAAPTSFHESPTRLAVDAIAIGAQVYARHCVACHGDDGRGEGPLAATLSRWPPTFQSPLLGRRAEGELFWHIMAGMRDRDGRVTMPAFGHQLDDAQAWAVIDYLKALAAGTGGAAQGSWPVPLRLPDVAVRCGAAAPRALDDWRGHQRVRVVAFDGVPATLPFDDPRFLTLLVTRDGRPPASIPDFRAGCVAASPSAWPAFAWIAGVDPERLLTGTTWLADRDGWLRAQTAPGDYDWSDASLVCTAGQPAARGLGDRSAGRAGQRPPLDGLTALLLRIDAEPVRFVQGGFVH